MKTIWNILFVALMVSPMIFFTGCSETEDAQQTAFYITDAPIDNAEVKSVFITIADLQVDGESVAAFEGRKTIDIKALNNGRTELIGMADLDIRAYQNVELVLDLAADASGNAMGCFVETFDGVRHDLAAHVDAATMTITTAGVELAEFGENAFVLDFDLRKAITAAASSQNGSDYSFVGEAALNAAVRGVTRANTGTLTGEVDDAQNDVDMVVVYAYEQGTYTAGEANAGPDGVQFQNAVTSAKASANGEFELHFLESGEYEVHFAAYEEQPDGSASFQGMIQVTGGIGLDTENVSVSASSETTIEATVLGVF